MRGQQDIRHKYVSERISNAVFYVPFAYLYQVRLGTPLKLLSWFFIYLMPCAFYGWLAFEAAVACGMLSGGAGYYALNFACLAVSVVSVYELGYIWNDTYATRREQQPAIRLYQSNLDHFYTHAHRVAIVRILWAMAALSVFLLIAVSNYCVGGLPNLIGVVVSVFAILPVFLLYNLWRGKWNVLLYPVLLFSRYLPFVLPYCFNYAHILLLFICVPLLSAIERFSMPRHRFPIICEIIPNEDSKTFFRIGYYCVAIIALHIAMRFCPQFLDAAVACASVQPTMTCAVFALSPFYVLLVYRIAVAVFTRFVKPRNYLNG